MVDVKATRLAQLPAYTDSHAASPAQRFASDEKACHRAQGRAVGESPLPAALKDHNEWHQSGGLTIRSSGTRLRQPLNSNALGVAVNRVPGPEDRKNGGS